ncbi:uncharacterized protein PRCAT00001489001 [Priceomyces carsonii]|uniref:uncharacterized protein n=1 Tax=Priceomyces carsonii TaxID=28549 RepID=UPI002ED8AFDD|nr:unnamed protein product [Priceomyces carsonii]
MWPDRIRVVKGTSSSGLAIGATNSSCQLMGIIGPLIYQSKFGPTYRVSYSCSIGLCAVSFIFIGLTWYLIHRRGILDTEGAVEELELSQNITEYETINAADEKDDEKSQVRTHSRNIFSL